MISLVCLAPVFNAEDTKPQPKLGYCSSLLGRIVPSMEKGVLGSNLILIIAAFAYVFFSLKLRLLGIGLGIYGMITTTVLANRLNSAEKSLTRVQSLQETIEGLQGKNSLTRSTVELDREIRSKQGEHQNLNKQIEKLRQAAKRYANQITNLKKEVRSLEAIKKKAD